MKKIIISIIVFIAIVLCFFILKISFTHPKLNMNDYVKIEIKNPAIITSDKSDIELIVSFLNSVNCKKNIFEDDTLKSPEMMIHLIKADNSYDTITVWGGAYKADTYIHYNNMQYKLNSRDSFYKQFDEIKTGIQAQLN